MTQEEFLKLIKSNGAIFGPAATLPQISLTNASLQQMYAANLPEFLIKIYEITGCINLGNGYIFGPYKFKNSIKSVIPDIIEINTPIQKSKRMHGKTILGRNDLFWFSFDSFGNCFMLDNLTLNPLRKYEDPYKSILDCLIAGKN